MIDGAGLGCAAECLPPSKLVQLSNQLLLGSFFALRTAGQTASLALHTLRRRVWGATHFPLAVKTHLGQSITVNAVKLRNWQYFIHVYV